MKNADLKVGDRVEVTWGSPRRFAAGYLVEYGAPGRVWRFVPEGVVCRNFYPDGWWLTAGRVVRVLKRKDNNVNRNRSQALRPEVTVVVKGNGTHRRVTRSRESRRPASPPFAGTPRREVR